MTSYVVHYDNLKLYECLGLEITKIRTGIKFVKIRMHVQYIQVLNADNTRETNISVGLSNCLFAYKIISANQIDDQ